MEGWKDGRMEGWGQELRASSQKLNVKGQKRKSKRRMEGRDQESEVRRQRAENCKRFIARLLGVDLICF